MHIVERCREYLSSGGLFNPELMDHQKVSDLVIDCCDEIERLRKENNAQFKYIEAERSIRIKLDNEIEKQDIEIERLREALQNTYDQILEGDLTEVFKTLRAALKGTE